MRSTFLITALAAGTLATGTAGAARADSFLDTWPSKIERSSSGGGGSSGSRSRGSSRGERMNLGFASDDTPRRGRGSAGGGGGGSATMASYYWQPQMTASGTRFNPDAMTAAHKTLPFGTKVRVTHARTGRSVVVTINDRGPYVAGRGIDLSRAAAGAIAMQGEGVAPVQIEVLDR